MKALVDAERDDILGFTMFGAAAGEVMAVVQTAMLGGLPALHALREATFTHPTMAEGLGELFGRVGERKPPNGELELRQRKTAGVPASWRG